jgi:hypothetical protein
MNATSIFFGLLIVLLECGKPFTAVEYSISRK